MMQTSSHAPVLPPAVSGTRHDFAGRSGRLSYYASQGANAAAATPLLLLHSINAAGSAYEVRPLYEHYGAQRPVYALDLPGFGFSERSARRYTPRLMTEAVQDMAAEIGARHGGVPIDAMALSLSCEFLARAASERPDSFRSLALVSPTGFGRGGPYRDRPGRTRGMPWLYAVLSSGGERLFKLLTSRVSIRFFLQKTWGSRAIDEGLFEYDYVTTHQSGAHHAPFDFVSGHLFSKDISSVYETLAAPVWMSHGTRGDFTDYSKTDIVAQRPNWTFSVFQTGALPYFEVQGDFTGAWDVFLARVGAHA